MPWHHLFLTRKACPARDSAARPATPDHPFLVGPTTPWTGIYGERRSTPTTEFVEAVRRMEENVRRRLEAERCYDQENILLRPLYQLPGLKVCGCVGGGCAT